MQRQHTATRCLILQHTATHCNRTRNALYLSFSRSLSLSLSQTRTHTPLQTHIHTHTHTHLHTHSQTHTHAYTHTHTHIPTHACTHMHTYAQTHTRSYYAHPFVCAVHQTCANSERGYVCEREGGRERERPLTQTLLYTHTRPQVYAFCKNATLKYLHTYTLRI